jgi:hypothetical protein
MSSLRGGYPDRVLIAGEAFATLMDSPKADYLPDGNNCRGH